MAFNLRSSTVELISLLTWSRARHSDPFTSSRRETSCIFPSGIFRLMMTGSIPAFSSLLAMSIRESSAVTFTSGGALIESCRALAPRTRASSYFVIPRCWKKLLLSFLSTLAFALAAGSLLLQLTRRYDVIDLQYHRCSFHRRLDRLLLDYHGL